MSEKNLNVALLAHVDAGKTSITEQLLYLSGSIRQAGKVDEGTSITDFMEVERKRGISVKTACVLLNWQGQEICLVDTPGHVDFVGEVERSLGVLDGAVLVISAVEGVQSHTQLIWKSLRKLNIPTLLFINKIDRIGADPERVMRQIKEELSPQAVLIQDYKGLETEECQIASPLMDQGDVTDTMKEELILALAQNDPELEERYLMEEEITLSEIREPFIQRSQEGLCFPVLAGSAKTGCGIPKLMDGIVHLLPDSGRLEISELSGIVFKIEHDPDMGKAAYVRLFGGHLQNRELIRIGENEAKITQIRRFSGQRYVDSGELNAGEIGTIYGLGSIQCGDVIGKAPENRECVMAVPLLMVKAEAENEEKLTALLSALQELSEEDPLLDLEWSPSTREMYVKITEGEFMLEAVLPVATSLDYPITFRSMTSGKGIYSSQFDGYREAPPEVQASLPRRGVDPLDIDKWILYCRNALV